MKHKLIAQLTDWHSDTFDILDDEKYCCGKYNGMRSHHKNIGNIYKVIDNKDTFISIATNIDIQEYRFSKPTKKYCIGQGRYEWHTKMSKLKPEGFNYLKKLIVAEKLKQ